MGTLLKFLLKFVEAVLIIAVVVVITSPFWVGPFVKGIFNTAAPSFTGTDAKIGSMYVNLMTGYAKIENLVIPNPKGCSEENALKVGNIEVDIAVKSLFKDSIEIENVEINDVNVTYVRYKDPTDPKFSGKNIDWIMNHVNGRSEELSEKSEESENSEDDESSGKKLVLDRVHVSGVVVKIGMLPLPVPEITLTDIGKDSGGVDLVDIANQCCDWLGTLGGKTLDGAGALLDGAGSVKDSVKSASSLIKGLLGQ